MSKKREFPILNGKLISDLDANGFKILGADIEVPAEKIKEAVAPELEAKADKTELKAEAQRAQEAEAALRGAVDGKVDAEAGKGLSTNDYTTEDKEKLGKAYTPENPPPAPDLSGYATKDEVMPLVDDHNGKKTAVTIGSRDGKQPVGVYSLANGFVATASGSYSHADGRGTTASGNGSHAEGVNTTASGDGSHAEGVNTTASGNYSHAEGSYTTASGLYSHADGYMAQTRSGDDSSFAWNGDEKRGAPYESHGSGTFNINPFGGLDGFYIGEQTLASILTDKADASSLAPVATSGNYDDLRGRPGNVSAFANDAGYLTAHQSWSDVKPSGGITASDLASAVQTSLGKADTALQAHQDISGKVDKEAGKGLSTNDYTNEDKAKLGTAYTPDNPPPAPDLSGYATKDAALPRYQFTSAGILDGVVTVPPYVYASMLSDGTAFTIAVGEGNSMYLRDCILCVQCGDVAPTITWPANFHPRTDAETDFACVAGATNVYWISEYVQGEFVVAGWQATAGGSAQ